jgi:hypothetical protein
LGAALLEDYFANGKRWWVPLHEKGGKRHEMPAHHKLQLFLDEYLDARASAIKARPPSSARSPVEPESWPTGRCIGWTPTRWSAGAPPRPD